MQQPVQDIKNNYLNVLVILSVLVTGTLADNGHQICRHSEVIVSCSMPLNIKCNTIVLYDVISQQEIWEQPCGDEYEYNITIYIFDLNMDQAGPGPLACRTETKERIPAIVESLCWNGSLLPGRVALGGNCVHNYQCLHDKICYNNETFLYYKCPQDKVCYNNETCRYVKDGDCDSNNLCASEYCRHGRCQPHSENHHGYVAEGALCEIDAHCYSGLCYPTENGSVCSRESSIKGKVGPGGFCQDDKHCSSGWCFMGKCEIDTLIPGKITGNGSCSIDVECYSGFCNGGKCAKNGLIPGKVDHLTPCNSNTHCLSTACVNNICLIRNGGSCNEDSNCYSAFCAGGKCSKDACVPGKVGINGSCESSDQCDSGNCDSNQCMPSPDEKLDLVDVLIQEVSVASMVNLDTAVFLSITIAVNFAIHF